MEYSQELLGRQIKSLRLNANMSQSDLAAKSGLAKGYISSLELGKGRSISIKSLDKLANALDTGMDTLISDSLAAYRKEDHTVRKRIIRQLNSCNEKQLSAFLKIVQSYAGLKRG